MRSRHLPRPRLLSPWVIDVAGAVFTVACIGIALAILNIEFPNGLTDLDYSAALIASRAFP